MRTRPISQIPNYFNATRSQARACCQEPKVYVPLWARILVPLLVKDNEISKFGTIGVIVQERWTIKVLRFLLRITGNARCLFQQIKRAK